MRMVKFVALLAALALVLAACGDDTADDANGAPSDGDDGEAVTAPDDDHPGAELDDDVAAVVDDEEISRDDVDQQVEAFSANPQVAEALEGPEGEQTLGLLRAQVVNTMIINKLAIEGAEELDNPVTDDDIAGARSELEDETGGAENLETALEQEGMTEEQLTVQLRALAALRNIEAALAEEADDDADPETLAQEYIQDRLRTADVVVNDDIGTWDAQTGQVTPPGGLPQQQPQAPQ